MAERLKDPDLDTTLGPVDVPSCPLLLARVIREGGAEDPDFNTIASAIEADPELGRGVLATVNSAAYGLTRKVSTVQAALMILGVRNAAMLLTALGVRSAFVRPNDVFGSRAWAASARTAGLTAMIAQQLARVPRDLAHLYGLFRDCGHGLLGPLDRDYADALKRSSFLDTRIVANFEAKRFGVDHAAAGERLATLWQLPPVIAWAIRHHHDFAAIDDYAEGPGGSGPTLVAIGLVADELAARLDRRTHPEWKSERLPFAEAMLALDSEMLEKLLDHARKVPFIP